MNRKEWLKSSGALLAGGISVLSTGFVPTLKKSRKFGRDITSTRRFISDQEYFQLFPQIKDLKARLMANENPFGPSPKAKEAIRGAIDYSYQYSIGTQEELITKIATHENINPKKIYLSAGSSPVLLAAAIYFSKENSNIITGEPSYADLPSKAEEFGTEVRWVPLTPEYTLDLKAMEAKVDENTSLVYICNPNNPTATVLDTAELKDFCKRVSKKTTVFVDEAYIDYLDNPDEASMISLVSEGYNVIVARTFSKVYGFAGLRVGYMIADEHMIKKLEKYSKGGMSISATSLAAATAAYLDMDYIHEVKTKNNESKDYLYSVLKKEGYTPIPSSANFVMFPIHIEGKRFLQEMLKRGVAVRSWAFNNQDWCRISIGKMNEMEAFAQAFHQIS